MTDFLKLYVQESRYLSVDFGLSLLIIYTNSALYLIDFYHLIKRKVTAETVALLIPPLVVAFMASVMANWFVHVPPAGELDLFVDALRSGRLCVTLSLLAPAYGLLWLLTLISQRGRKREDIRRWVLACIPDYCLCAGILLGFAGYLWEGISFFESHGQIYLWLYLYCLYLLACKMALLLTGNLVRLYTMRIRCFRWREGKNPAAFVARFFWIYQNGMGRSAFLYCAGMMFCTTILPVMIEGFSPEFLVTGFVLLECVLIVFGFSTSAVRKGMARFDLWGDSAEVKRLFCQEYFTGGVLYRNQYYTVTRHFLVDEQAPAVVWHWDYLCRVSGISADKNGKCRILSFTDGLECRMSMEEAEASEEVFRYAERVLQMRQMKFG